MTSVNLKDRRISIVIPTYNEAKRLPRTLDEIIPFLGQSFADFEIIIVDDGSPDGTAEIARSYAPRVPHLQILMQPSRIGKGAAVRRGCLAAKFELVLFMDADHATPIEEVADMIELLDRHQAEVVAGVRTYQQAESRWRRTLGLMAILLAHLIVFRKGVVDSQCGFKLFTREAATKLFPYCRVNGGMLDVELFYHIHMLDMSCWYQPVHWENKAGSTINVWKCMLVDPLELVGIRLRSALGLYKTPLPELKQPWRRSVS